MIQRILLLCIAFFLSLPSAWGQVSEGKTTAKVAVSEALLAKYDLRKFECVTPIRKQSGGTCWAHGTMAAIESNMLKCGTWAALKREGMPNLAEYHLDWWNGFNQYKNLDADDPAKTKGLRVHLGGDYRVSAAYISRGEGVVCCQDANDDNGDNKWYKTAPDLHGENYERFYVRNIEWFALDEDMKNIDVIKKRIISEGAVGTAYCVSKKFLSKDNIHYQPQDNLQDPNHAVAIVGWDDSKITTDDKATKPQQPGAWLIKNSWGTVRGEKGYYWISYYDRHSCRHPEMGAVSFRNTEPLRYQHFYYHDYHGWRDALPKMSRAFNAFKARGHQDIKAVSFYTAEDNVTYTARIYRTFSGGELSGEAAVKKGTYAVKGLHTVDLDAPVTIRPGEKFFVYLEVSHGGQAIDRTSEIPVLLQQKQIKKNKNPIVPSRAAAGESYYHDGTRWQDLYDYDLADPDWATFDRTANFCMKALTVDVSSVQAQP
jgi:C1A family cysteine protease